MAAIPIAERNYQRKAHRVTFPLSVEINGKTYSARDWSLLGVGLEGFDLELEIDQTIPARCIVPVPGCFFAMKVTLQLKNRRTNLCGFEFHNFEARSRRVLRQYMENAIEGKNNAEDLLSVAAMPSIASPIEEALNLTELETEGLLRKFKAKSYLSIVFGILFVTALAIAIFYNTVYRIHATGLVSGNIERVTANSSGVVKATYVKPNTYIDAGTKLFSVEDPNIAIELDNVHKSLADTENQIQVLRARDDQHESPLIASLRQELKKKKQEFDNASRLYENRIISIKDYNFVENQYQQAYVSHQRALEEAERNRSGSRFQLEELAREKGRLVIQRDALIRRQAQQTIAAPVKGKVFHIEHATGEYVAPNDVMVLIEKNTPPNVLLKLITEDALKIRIGMDANVHVPATDTKHKAKVVAVGYSSVNSQATVTQEASLNETLVRLEFVDKDVRLPANTRVKVWIKTF